MGNCQRKLDSGCWNGGADTTSGHTHRYLSSTSLSRYISSLSFRTLMLFTFHELFSFNHMNCLKWCLVFYDVSIMTPCMHVHGNMGLFCDELRSNFCTMGISFFDTASLSCLIMQESQKVALAESTGLDLKQINNWFINQRKRHWKPSEDMQFVVMDATHPQYYCIDNVMCNPFPMDCTTSMLL